MTDTLNRLRVGDWVSYEGVDWEVVQYDQRGVVLDSALRGTMAVTVRRLCLDESFENLSNDAPTHEAVVNDFGGIYQLLPDDAKAVAGERLRVVNTALYGHPEGKDTIEDCEARFDPASTSLTERIALLAADRAAESGKKIESEIRKINRWQLSYKKDGLAALVDARHLKVLNPLDAIPRKVVDASYKVAARDLQNASTLNRTVFKGLVQEQLDRTVNRGASEEKVINLPPDSTWNRWVRTMGRGEYWFADATSRRENDRSTRKNKRFHQFQATHAGQLIEMDSSGLNVLLRDEEGRTQTLDITVAFDVRTSAILGYTLQTTAKGVDHALLLADIIRPLVTVADSEHLDVHRQTLAAGLNFELSKTEPFHPLVVPETIVIDNGLDYTSKVVTEACRILGISVRNARKAKGNDKGHVERFFKTLDNRLLQYLGSGYRGRSVAKRGKDIEADMTLDEFRVILDEFFFHVWPDEPGKGRRQDSTPRKDRTPRQMYFESVARTGIALLPDHPNLHLQLLPVEERAITHQGVELRKLFYDCDELNSFRGRSVSRRSGSKPHRWPFHYDPRDLRQIHFCDPDTGDWITIPWKKLDQATVAPFSETTLKYVTGHEDFVLDDVLDDILRLQNSRLDPKTARSNPAVKDAVNARADSDSQDPEQDPDEPDADSDSDSAESTPRPVGHIPLAYMED